MRHAACGPERAQRRAQRRARHACGHLTCTLSDGARKSASAAPSRPIPRGQQKQFWSASRAVSPRQCFSWQSTAAWAPARGALVASWCLAARARRSPPVRPPGVAPDARAAPRRAARAPRRAEMCSCRAACAFSWSAGGLSAHLGVADSAQRRLAGFQARRTETTTPAPRCDPETARDALAAGCRVSGLLCAAFGANSCGRDPLTPLSLTGAALDAQDGGEPASARQLVALVRLRGARAGRRPRAHAAAHR